MPERSRPLPWIVISLYACEIGLAGYLLGTHKLAEQDWWRLGGRLATATACALALALGGGVALLWSMRRARRSGAGRSIRLSILLNLFTLAAALLAGEGALRLLARPAPRGASVLGLELLPYSWESLRAHHRRLIRPDGKRPVWTGSFLVDDPDLGWTVGPDRSSSARFCYSSAEGIRSPTPGVSYTERARGRRVVALVGDSYTFGLDVRYEESWAGRLQHDLGDGFVVLNFGVDGYGVGQAHLRYLRDVVPWKPEVVIFGMIQHDFVRTLAVYPFLSFPTWGFPFSKPRFELSGGMLALRNSAPPAPDAIFDRPRIGELPCLEYEPAYVASEWRPTPLSASYMARLLLTRFRPAPRTVEEAPGPLNTAILRAFRERCAAEGSKPLLVYIPTNGGGDFPETARGRADEGMARRALETSGLGFLDLTPSLQRLPPERRFLPHGHYSPDGNAAAADGILAALRPLLFRRDRAPR